MTILNPRYRYLFIHVPKAAGKSIKNHLLEHSFTARERLLLNAGFSLQNLNAFLAGKPVLDHLPRAPFNLGPVDRRLWEYSRRKRLYTAAHLRATQLQEALGERDYGDLFSFTFVRNPWDRCLSAYRYIQTHPRHPMHRAAMSMSFEDFLRRQEEQGLPYLGRQVDWIYRNGEECLVDFIGKTERIEADMARVQAQTGIDGPAFATWINRSGKQRGDYRAAYTIAGVDIVARCMGQDAALLDYAFE